MSFADPLWLLLFLPLGWLIWRRPERMTLRVPHPSTALKDRSLRTIIRAKLPLLRWFALAMLIFAMARPQRNWEEQKIKADALDIVLCMDISPSMLSRDFEPDRLAVAKQVAADFVEKRPHDRIGLVAFSAEAFTQCPLTTDRRVVQTFINELSVGRLEDGTAIGMGLATAINRLKDNSARSKIVVLLTDGENNAGYIAPLKAAEIAKTLGVRVYAVGIGTEGVVMSPTQRMPDGSYAYAPRFMRFDTQLLEDIALATGGKFYRAFSERDLRQIYAEIDQLEKTKIEVSTLRRSADYFHWFIAAAVFLILLEFVGVWGLFRSVTP